MKPAIASRVVVSVLAFFALAAFAGAANAQGKAERELAPVAPNLSRRPAPLPPLPRPERQGSEEEGPSANDEPPAHGRGCPDQGRKLELIV